jgi:hypothetical protein
LRSQRESSEGLKEQRRMDPDQALEDMHEAWVAVSDGLDRDEIDYDRVVVLVNGWRTLDVWLSRGGALPKAWEPLAKP